MMFRSVMSVLLATLAVTADARAAEPASQAPKKVLFFTKSSGFQHDVVKRKDDQLGLAETTLIELGKKHNIEVTASKDGSLFTPEKLAQFDAFAFETTGDLTTAGDAKDGNGKPDGIPMPPDGKENLL